MMVDVLRRSDELRDLAAPWAALAEAAHLPPTARPRWYAAAAEALHPPERLSIVPVWRGAELVAVAPLVLGGTAAGGRLEVVGSRDLHEPSGLAHGDAEALDALLAALLALGRPLHLGRLPTEGPELARLHSVAPRRAVVARRATTGTPFIPIQGAWDDFEAALPADRRSSLRRNGRRADEAGGFSFEVTLPGPTGVGALLADVVAVEHRSWKGAAGTSLAVDGRLRAFYEAYAHRAAAAGELCVSRLWVGSDLAAAQLAVVSAGRLWTLKLGCDERWSRCAPGIVLTHRSLEWAFERGLEGYELLGDAAPWTRVWTHLVHPHDVVRVYPRSARAAAGLALDLYGQARKRRRPRDGR